MKWLILLMLVACGKHEEPVALDLRDRDGDQIKDYKEGEFEKYVANFDKLGKVTGVIKFNTHKLEEISFSNGSDLNEETLKLVTGDDSDLKRDQFFSEWTELKLTLNDQKIQPTVETTTLHIHFDNTEVKPDELVLLNEKVEKQLGNWSEDMRIHLSKNELNGLLSGKMQLVLRKKFPKAEFYLSDSEETIREKTYKVHTFDGTKSRVLYVSKELPFSKLLEFLKIDEITKVTDEDLFFDSKAQGGKRWFQRDFPNGNKAFAFYTIQDLKEVFRNKFNRKKINLERVNGSPVTTLVLDNQAKAKIFLTIRPTRTVRTFSEYTEKTSHRTGSVYHGSDDSWTCTHYKRKIETEVTLIPTVEEFLNNLNVKFDLDKEFKLIEQNDEKGIFWEVMITAPQPNLALSLAGLNSSTFTTTGEHYRDCGHHGKGHTAATPTNFEGKLSFSIESFVEKVQ